MSDRDLASDVDCLKGHIEIIFGLSPTLRRINDHRHPAKIEFRQSWARQHR